MKTVLIAGLFTIIGATIGAFVSYKIADENNSFAQEKMLYDIYDKILLNHSHRTKILDMENNDYWESRSRIMDQLDLLGSKEVIEAGKAFVEASDNARAAQLKGNTKDWQSNPNSPYNIWDTRRKELKDAMGESLPNLGRKLK